MKLKTVEVENHKCFWEAQKIEFAPDCTVVLGQNSTGKSALLECIRLINLPTVPHRSSLSLPTAGAIMQRDTRVSLAFELEGPEIVDVFSWDGRINVFVPEAKSSDINHAREIATNLLRSDKLWLKIVRTSSPPAYNTSLWGLEVRSPSYPTARFSAGPREVGNTFTQPLPIADINSVALGHSGRGPLGGVDRILDKISSSIFRFNAERFNIGIGDTGPIPKLASDASNLPTVLNHLNAVSRTRFSRFLSAAREILPTITDIAIVPILNQKVEIKIATDENYEDRDDLSQSVMQGGSGICQVLAMLYVAMTERTPQIIILDEPDSFLHPGATRKLMQLLRSQERRHQYIISTHSTEVVRGANPSAIAHVVWDLPRSRVKMLDPAELDQMRGAFLDLGIQLSDIYGADAIIWVEGATEKSVLPLIWNHARAGDTKTVEFLPVISTGDFESKKKHRELAAQIYRELSTAKSLTPPSVGFIFDREKKSDTEIADKHREYNGAVGYLKRRTLENYLLNSEAIAQVLLQRQDNKDSSVTSQMILEWIQSQGTNEVYFRPLALEGRTFDLQWLKNVNAPLLLADLFDAFGRVPYRKTSDSLALARAVLSIDPAAFEEVVQVIKGVLASAG